MPAWTKDDDSPNSLQVRVKMPRKCHPTCTLIAHASAGNGC